MMNKINTIQKWIAIVRGVNHNPHWGTYTLLGFYLKTKNLLVADALRDGLASSGIVVEDTPTGARWSLAEES